MKEKGERSSMVVPAAPPLAFSGYQKADQQQPSALKLVTKEDDMDINTVRAFFMWCTIINGAVLILSSLILVFGGNFVYRIHSKWFAMPRETFNAVIYGFLGFYKVMFITFNLVPYLALSVMA